MLRGFINDIKTFLILIFEALFFIFCLFFSLRTADDRFSIIACICVCGGFLLLVLFCLMVCTEIITIYDDKIVSKKIWKQKEILYADIVCIEEGYDRGAYATGIEEGWKIIDSYNQTIFVVGIRSRKWCVDFIKQHTNKIV